MVPRGREGPGRQRPSARRPPVHPPPPRARPRPSAASPGGTRAANDEAGFDVGHFIGWRRSISSGWCSTGSHTTFHTRPRRSIYIYTCIHVYIYIQSRGPSPCHHPAGQVVGAILHAGHGGLAPLAAQRLHPFSLIPSPPRRLPFAHLSLPTGECSGPTENRRPEPTTRSPLAHRASRQRPRRPRRSVLLSVTAWHRPYGSTLRIRLVITDDTDMSRTPPHSGYKRPLHPLDRLPFLFFLQTRCSRRWLQ